MGGLQLTTRYLCKLGMGMNRYSSFVYTSSFDPPLMGFSIEVFYMFISKKMLFIFKAKISASIARPLPDGLE